MVPDIKSNEKSMNFFCLFSVPIDVVPGSMNVEITDLNAKMI
jgi:hypothetical protein